MRLPDLAPVAFIGTAEAIATERGAPRPLVLVVDDERDVLDALESALVTQGWRVVTAVNGAEALDKAVQLRPDLVLTDLLMPVIDGIGLAKSLRAHPRTATTFIVLCSGVSEASVKGLFDGYDAFLHKPYELEDLRRTIAVLRPHA